jgi:penicillin amidase
MLCLVLVGGAAFIGIKLQASLPVLEGTQHLPGLLLPVQVTSDRYGIPTIAAQSRLDAIRALGYVTARDRLFQMDLLRRHSAGRLAEIFGNAALQTDIRQRSIGFNRVAPAILANLPPAQREVLQAYTEGVNAFIAHMHTPPFECLLLGYRPDRWTMTDSILVALNLFQTLSGDEDDERMLTIMETVLPPQVVAFLTPDTDSYTTVLFGGGASHRPIRPIPVKAMSALRHFGKIPPPPPFIKGGNGGISGGPQQNLPLSPFPKGGRAALQAVSEESLTGTLGSNSWVVDQSKTADGRAILANDMHMQLSVPNVWYRAMLRYADVKIAGVIVPGIPAVVAGSNTHVAWGVTNSKSDVLDLVRLEINPANPEEYRVPSGWKRFDRVAEMIRVKGGKQVVAEVKLTIWGPVSPQPLLGHPVAIHWTALDPQAVDMGLLSMDAVATLTEALDVINRFRGPPLNVLIADKHGHIAWTYGGRIPVRQGFDGASSKSWADGRTGWEGYIPPEALPRVIDPPAGFLVTANNRTLGKDYPYVIGHNFAHSYRAYQISKQLREMDNLSEQDMFQLQLDTTSRFYDFYQQLALRVLSEAAIAGKPLLAAARQHIRAWNGRADIESVGFALLVQFRETLLVDVFAPFLRRCQKADPAFFYAWRNQETPLRMLLSARIPELLPEPTHYATWDVFIRDTLEKSLQQLRRDYQATSLEQLTWGRVNTASIAHPLALALPLLGQVLNMPREALPGCTYCVRTTGPDWGAAERLVVSPGRHDDGILHMPGGQSGHPLSPNYRDQHRFWVQGEPLPFLPGPTVHTLILEPDPRHLMPVREEGDFQTPRSTP